MGSHRMGRGRNGHTRLLVEGQMEISEVQVKKIDVKELGEECMQSPGSKIPD